MIIMSSINDEDVLRGKTMRVYRYVLKNRKPTGVREVQRALKFSSPRLASYHLNKLEDAGLVKKTIDGYVVERVFLQHSVRLWSLLVPRYLFYSVFFVVAIIVQLTLFKPSSMGRDYVFGLVVILIASLFFLYETFRIVLRKGL